MLSQFTGGKNGLFNVLVIFVSLLLILTVTPTDMRSVN